MLILASSSPRRKELMTRLFGRDGFEILVPRFDEGDLIRRWCAAAGERGDGRGQSAAAGQEALDSLTRSLAQGKLDALASQYALPVRVVAVAADTLVCLEGNLLGKPSGAEDAARMLRLLSGKVHEVKTGIAMLAVSATDSFSQLAVETTRVKFADLDDRQIAWYLATGEPSDKAGAYAIQGYGAALVEWISGCYYNVMGLPVFRLMDMLRSAADHFDSDSSFRDLLPWA